MRQIILLCFASGAWCGSIRIEQLTIWVYDYALVSTQTLDKALVESQEIFLKAEIEITWVKCRPFIEDQCVPPLQSTDVLVKIVSETANQKMQPFGALGSVLRDKKVGLWTYVFYNPIEHEARYAGLAAYLLLGMVITHELGHFFGLEHRFKEGIMLPGFRQREMLQALSGQLTFDKAQAQYLRTAIATRLHQVGMAK